MKTFQKSMALSLMTATILISYTPELVSAASNKRSSDDARFARIENELAKMYSHNESELSKLRSQIDTQKKTGSEVEQKLDRLETRFTE